MRGVVSLAAQVLTEIQEQLAACKAKYPVGQHEGESTRFASLKRDNVVTACSLLGESALWLVLGVLGPGLVPCLQAAVEEAQGRRAMCRPN